jgi:hypothetical protein
MDFRIDPDELDGLGGIASGRSAVGASSSNGGEGLGLDSAACDIRRGTQVLHRLAHVGLTWRSIHGGAATGQDFIR